MSKLYSLTCFALIIIMEYRGETMQRITKNPDIRRQEILDASIKLFVEKGYEQTSMLEISKSINVSQGLCYRYFKSKEEIYQAVLNSYVSQGVDCFVSMLGDENQSIISIIANMKPLCVLQDANDIYHQFFNAPNHNSFHIQMELALINQLIPIVSKRLESAKLNGEIHIDNPLSAAAYYLYGQLGIWQLDRIKNNDKEVYIKNYTKKLLGV